MIFYHLWRAGLLAGADAEKVRFFFGLTGDPLLLSRRRPLVRAIDWMRALCSPKYARQLAVWLRYRVELFDGLQG
jgi:hypothetical protein